MAWHNGKERVYLMRPDGRDLERLVRQRGNQTDPCLSPSASAIAFTSDLDGNPEIYRIDLQGQNLRRLTDNRLADRHPSWSPDGDWLVFTSERWGGRPELARMSAEGGEPERLTFDQMGCSGPTWSPDGRKVAYASYRDGQPEIFVLELDSRESRRVTFNGVPDVEPAWAPDSGTLVWQTTRSWGSCLAMANLDHPDEAFTLAGELAPVQDPTFSADGNTILFASRQREHPGLYQINLQAGRPTGTPRPQPVGGAPVDPGQPDWQRVPLPW